MSKKLKIQLFVRLLVGVIASFLIIKSLTIHGQPFGGCKDFGLSTIKKGCTSWHFFGLGLAIVLMIWVIKPKYKLAKYLGFIFILLLALLGGPEAIKYGFHLDIFKNPSNLSFYWRTHGLSIILGGIIGFLVLFTLEKIVMIHSQNKGTTN